MATLTLQGLTKEFSSTIAVRGIDAAIPSGQFFSILGPSGCGKTTLLRMIAGFEKPTSGSILIDGRDVTAFPPQRRGIGMVFQNYALFPHMDVFDNVAYGLRARKETRENIRAEVEKVLATVDLAGKRNVPVPELSGGEQQRVAVARALVIRPSILLFDEPLSNLDVALRVRTREEIRRLQRDTGITTVYVTHDQGESMSLADRIAVMRSGILEQVGTPAELYNNPQSPFVAQFLGDANILKGIQEGSTLILPGLDVRTVVDGAALSGNVLVAIKPEAIRLDGSTGDLAATVLEREFLGYTTQFRIRIQDAVLRVAMLSSAETARVEIGDAVRYTVDWNRCSFFPGWDQ